MSHTDFMDENNLTSLDETLTIEITEYYNESLLNKRIKDRSRTLKLLQTFDD